MLMKFKASNEELRILSQVINEICYGLNLDNFKQRIGTSRETAEIFLKRLNSVYMSQVENYIENNDTSIIFNTEESMIIKSSMDTLIRFFDESDFENRLGCVKKEFLTLKEKIM